MFSEAEIRALGILLTPIVFAFFFRGPKAGFAAIFGLIIALILVISWGTYPN